DPATAQSYFSSGNYLWNAGMFVWQTGTILSALEKYLPATAKTAREIAAAPSLDAQKSVAAQLYSSLQKISIDFAVMEKAPGVLMLEMDLDWLDVGHWTSLAYVLGHDANGNTVSGARLVQIDAQGNIVVSESDHLVATIGIHDSVIIHSPDATLICPRDQI